MKARGHVLVLCSAAPALPGWLHPSLSLQLTLKEGLTVYRDQVGGLGAECTCPGFRVCAAALPACCYVTGRLTAAVGIMRAARPTLLQEFSADMNSQPVRPPHLTPSRPLLGRCPWLISARRSSPPT